MYFDVVLKRTSVIQEFANKLGYSWLILKSELKIVDGGLDKNRKAVENKNVDILLNPHINELHDHMHYRQSGLNDVLCKLARKNNVAVAVSLDQFKDPISFGRIMQNVRFCRKYKVVFLILSLATDEYELKAPKDVEALYRIIGCSGKMVNEAWNFLNSKNNKKKLV